MTKTTAAQTEALTKLQVLLNRDQHVYTVLRHVSGSGMQRAISVHISHLVAAAGIFPRHTRHDGLKVNGCGMDMGFHVVYELAGAVFGEGYALKHRWI